MNILFTKIVIVHYSKSFRFWKFKFLSIHGVTFCLSFLLRIEMLGCQTKTVFCSNFSSRQ